MVLITLSQPALFNNNNIDRSLQASPLGGYGVWLQYLKKERKKEKETMFIKIKNIWYYNVYILKLKLSINYSD